MPLLPLRQDDPNRRLSEADIQALVQAHPAVLPIREIDPIFADPIPICTELSTSAGLIDNLLVTSTGLPVIVECKLWKNPEGRREVVAQILDYAKELCRWSSADLQRVVRQRLGHSKNPLLERVQAQYPLVDETAFNDALTANLRRGRFLLLIVGDGIREGVEAIAEYLQDHAGLHFTMGLVELPFYVLPSGDRIVVPRVLARTVNVIRTVIDVPEGYMVRSQEDLSSESSIADPERTALSDAQQRFWSEFLQVLKLDDPEQQIPRPARQGYLGFMMPAPSGSSWLTVYRDFNRREIGLFLSSHRNTAGSYAMQAVAEQWDDIRLLLGGTAKLTSTRDGRDTVTDTLSTGFLDQADVRRIAFAWLAERVNTFVNVLRPRVRSAVADYRSRES
ncbi:hypothetical protein MKK67_19530 [Methylobacterium sp. J-072]|uniref:hypothetical protein n=1 Tax=Methylobacterium sp. J-072 TaxID=2836651 RepID=UPI001FB915C0|nr:hypothetical protein [Methylobacterium sp. J-072]MCJ2094669.1 hypothetical protein [Methylobacterium sp. J-072]